MLRRCFSLLNFYKGDIMTFTKPEAIAIFKSCAQEYKRELLNRNLLVVFGTPSNMHFVQLAFGKKNFEHLTGVISHLQGKDRKNLFYIKSLQGNLSPNDFDFRDDGTTEMKISTLKEAMKIAHTAKQIGDYNNKRPKIIADKATGTSRWCIALVDEGGGYLRPCSLLNDDTRNNTTKSLPVIGILRRKRDDPHSLYKEITYTAKDIDVCDLLASIRKVFPTQISDTMYGLVKNPDMTNPASDPYIATEYRLNDGVFTRGENLFIGKKPDCDHMIQSYSEDKPPPQVSIYQLKEPDSEQGKLFLDKGAVAIKENGLIPTADMFTKVYEFGIPQISEKGELAKKLNEIYERFRKEPPAGFHGRKLGVGDVIIFDNIPFMINKENFQAVLTLKKEKAIEGQIKNSQDVKDKVQDKLKKKKPKR